MKTTVRVNEETLVRMANQMARFEKALDTLQYVANACRGLAANLLEPGHNAKVSIGDLVHLEKKCLAALDGVRNGGGDEF